MDNQAALTIDLILCEEDEECVPFPKPRENNMMPSIEIGYDFTLERMHLKGANVLL